MYNDRRECVPPTHCSAACSEAVGGTVIDNVGLCECSIVSDPELVCDSTCRNAKDRYTLNSQGQIVVTTAASSSTTYQASQLS